LTTISMLGYKQNLIKACFERRKSMMMSLLQPSGIKYAWICQPHCAGFPHLPQGSSFLSYSHTTQYYLGKAMTFLYLHHLFCLEQASPTAEAPEGPSGVCPRVTSHQPAPSHIPALPHGSCLWSSVWT
jgi:hypothetical protein